MMTVQLTQVTQWRRIGGIHAARFRVKAFGLFVFFVHFRLEPALHDGFDLGALRGIKNGTIEDGCDIVQPEFLEFFGGLFGFSGEKALFIHHRAENRNSAIFIPGF